MSGQVSTYGLGQGKPACQRGDTDGVLVKPAFVSTFGVNRVKLLKGLKQTTSCTVTRSLKKPWDKNGLREAEDTLGEDSSVQER